VVPGAGNGQKIDPKAEMREKPEIRDPKTEHLPVGQWPRSEARDPKENRMREIVETILSESTALRLCFGFRISGFGLLSAFGSRVSDLTP